MKTLMHLRARANELAEAGPDPIELLKELAHINALLVEQVVSLNQRLTKLERK